MSDKADIRDDLTDYFIDSFPENLGIFRVI